MSSSGAAARTPAFGVVVPVKPTAVAKSRLAPMGDEARRELVAAFAADTVAAAASCPLVRAVLVVTDDLVLATGLRGPGVDAIPDGHAADLNASLVQGAAELVRRHPDVRPVALCADLPTLRPADLAEVLAVFPDDGPAFVGDAAGTGTTLYCAPDLRGFDPRFGAGSRALHTAAGATDLTQVAPPRARQDVDVPADVAAALALGLGPRSAFVVTRLGLARA